MNLLRGMRDKISKYVNVDSEICIEMRINGSSIYDFCCFGVDKSGMLSDGRYMISCNQISSPNNEIHCVSENNTAKFYVNLSKLPSNIDKLVFTASNDGNSTMEEISKHSFYLSQNNNIQISMELSGVDFKGEKAIISVEIYRKGEWRIASVAKGFNGGLSALLAAYGGTEVFAAPSESKNISQEQSVQLVSSDKHEKSEEELTQKIMGKISLSKDKVKLEKHVANLSKCIVSLSKKSGIDLGSTNAKVVVVLDYSVSMSRLYLNGTVQHTICRLVPLGLTFDDNGSIDVYLFQDNYRKISDLTLSNYENYVAKVINASGYIKGGTNYAPVLTAIIEGDSYKQGGVPTFILFVTDGENFDKNETNEIIRKSSDMNVFIQFIGIGDEKFRYLKMLDDIPGRKRDNTGFSKMEDLDKADDNELYTNVLKQFSGWLKGLQ